MDMNHWFYYVMAGFMKSLCEKWITILYAEFDGTGNARLFYRASTLLRTRSWISLLNGLNMLFIYSQIYTPR